MKNLIAIIALALLSTTAFGQSKAIAAFYKMHSGDEASVRINLSGSFLNFLSDDDDDNDGLKKVTSIKILTVESKKVSESKFNALTKAVRAEGYEEWIMVKEGKNEEILFLAREKGNVITDLVMLVRGDDEYVVLELTGEIDPDKFDDDMNIDIDGFEHLKKAKKKKN